MVHWGTYIAGKIPSDDVNQFIGQVKIHLGEIAEHIAWLNPTYIHLTLHFIGWLNSKQSYIVNKELEKFRGINIASSSKIFCIGWNPNEQYIAIKVEKSEEIIYMHTLIKDKLASHKIFVKDQDFIPHISLGRIHPSKICKINNIELPMIQKNIHCLNFSLYESVSDSKILLRRE